MESYERRWGALERSTIERLRSFVRETKDCFHRTHLAGHVTGSALVVTPDASKILLTLHRKLGKWLQLGGHAEGNPLVHDVALREAEEESGLAHLHFWQGSPELLDIDIHQIPGRPGEPEHVHYDARYLIVAPNPIPIAISDESADLRWFPVEEAYRVAGEPSLIRLFDKLRLLTSG